jgi:hypothetical protein
MLMSANYVAAQCMKCSALSRNTSAFFFST